MTSALESARCEWQDLCNKQLPNAAKDHEDWPVSLNHCFGRIILDKVVGGPHGKPWHEVILKKPAYKHMSLDQLQDAIELGKAVMDDQADLNKLNEQSLKVRQKQGPAKRKADSQPALSFAKSPKKAKVDHDELGHLYSMVASSEKTPFQKSVLKILCQVPAGRFTTYGDMAKYLDSHPRSIGQAMKNNPFAPDVPCHRVLAANGAIGGYGGCTDPAGQKITQKIKILKEEGLKFDSKGRALGQSFTDFDL